MTQKNFVARRGPRALARSRGPAPAYWLTGLIVLAGLMVWSSLAQARSAPASFADLAEKLLPTVVNIATTQTIETSGRSEEFEEFFKEFFERRGGQPPQPERRRATSLGSGFVIDASGYIVTNNHVIAEADEISVRLHDDTTLEAITWLLVTM